LGLDIIAYSRLKKNEYLSNNKDEDKDYIDGNYLVMSPVLTEIDKAFPGRAEPLKYNGDVYDYENCEWISIGSYGTYGWFRRALEAFSENRDCFNELIHFSDCEGVIGSIVSKKLYEDFSSNQELFEQWAYQKYSIFEGELLMQMYHKFEWAFEIAKDGGAVEFC